MRRQHNNSSGSSPSPSGGIPFEEDLIFYAPLTEGDLTDHIKGGTFQVKNNATTITWDSSKGMYLIDNRTSSPSYFGGGLICYTSENIPVADGFTIVAYVEQTVGVGNNYAAIVSAFTNNLYDSTTISTSLHNYRLTGVGGGSSTTEQSDRVIGYCVVTGGYNSNPKYQYYLNTTAKLTGDWDRRNQTYNYVGLVVNCLNTSHYAYYIKDVRIYKRTFSASEIQELITPPVIEEPPSAPSSVTVSMSTIGTTVSWNGSVGATSYKVYRSSSESGTYTLLTTLNGVSYNDQNPISGYNYYKIVASNEYGDSQMSSATSINFVVPSAPTNVTGSKSPSGGILISWNEVSNTSSYIIYRCGTASGEYIYIGETSYGTTIFTDTNPLSADNYYKVRATNGAGDGPLSNYVYVDNSSGPDIPFSEYLVFYAPLTENDLTDHISGNSPTTMSNCTKTWDSTKQMWLLKSEPNRSGYYVSPLRYQGLTSVPVINSSNPITLVIDVAGVNAGNNYCAMMIVPDWSTAGKSYGTAYMGEVRFGGIDTSVHRYVGVFANNTVTWYKDGVQKGSGSWSFSNPYIGARGVAICMANDTNRYYIYASNARIYNKAFTAAEVAQL